MSSSRAKQNRPGRRLTAVYRRGFEDGGRAALGAAMSAAEPVSYQRKTVYGWREVDVAGIPHYRSVGQEIRPLYAAPATPSVTVKGTPEALEQFTAYFVKNYPGPDTIIFDPRWHAPKIFRAAVSALSAQVLDEPLRVGRFGHHPEPAIDFCIEVEALEGHLFDAKHGIGKPGHEPRRVDDDFRRRVSDAMDFIVGGDRIAIAAKATLKSISAQVQDLADSPAIKAIVAERARQIEKEGWSPEHDDEHTDGSLALAAACYALQAAQRSDETPYEDRPGRRRWRRTHLAIVRFWPWHWGWWKPVDRQRDLEKAGALIAAELDRVIRAAAPAKQEGGQ